MSQTPSSSPPVTTRQRGTSATIKKTQKELENAEGINTDVRSREQAIAFLQAKEYLVPGKSVDLHTLAHVLLQFGNAAVRAPKAVIDGIRAVAFLVVDAGAQQMAGEVTSMVKVLLQEHIENLTTNTETVVREAVEGVTHTTRKIADQMDELKEELRETADYLSGSTQELLHTTQDLVEKTDAKTAPTQNTAEHQAYPGTYAVAVQTQIPTAHAAVVSKGETTDKQILIQKDPNATDNALDNLTERDLVTKANTAIDLMGIEATDAPTGIAFVGAKKLRNGNVLYQFNTRDAAIWFNQPGVQQAFLTKYGGTSNIKNKLFYVVAEFVPTTFNAGTKSAHAHIEEDSSIGTDTIAYSKYIKPPHLRASNQRVAHVIIGFSDRNNANKAIEYGLFIEGKQVKVRKLLSEPRRCLKCQRFGHHVPDCKENTDTCARCKGQHRTALCDITETVNFACANCTGDEAKGHRAADRNCPTFAKEQVKLGQRVPENKYKYFPSYEPRTWCLLNQPETMTNTMQPVWQQNNDGMTQENYAQPQQFMDNWQTVRRRRGYQMSAVAYTQGGGTLPATNVHTGAADTGWPTQPAQSTLDNFVRPIHPPRGDGKGQQEHQNLAWGDRDTNEQGIGPIPEASPRQHTPLSYVGQP